eukprot:GHVU01179100.1.p2 GENE.GHVU01179100.1~~GHVU01179100.1.p2  ORF type:complete len:472 (-),score=59.51 GHVU01179100.1:985-2400(-)
MTELERYIMTSFKISDGTRTEMRGGSVEQHEHRPLRSHVGTPAVDGEESDGDSCGEHLPYPDLLLDETPGTLRHPPGSTASATLPAVLQRQQLAAVAAAYGVATPATTSASAPGSAGCQSSASAPSTSRTAVTSGAALAMHPPEGKGGSPSVPAPMNGQSNLAAAAAGAVACAARPTPGVPPPKVRGGVRVAAITAPAGKVIGRDRRRKDWHRSVTRITVEASRQLPPGVTRPSASPLTVHWKQQLEGERTAHQQYNTLCVEVTGALRGLFQVQVSELVGGTKLLLGCHFGTYYDRLSDAQKDKFVCQQVEILCKAILRFRKIAEVFRLPAPPVFPHEFKAHSQDEFLTLLKTHHSKLLLAYGHEYEDKRETLIDEHTKLRLDTEVLCAPADAVSATFASKWTTQNGKYPNLFRLAKGLATVYPSNADVERDFAILKWLFSPQRASLSVSSLVGTMLCRQLEALRRIVRGI